MQIRGFVLWEQMKRRTWMGIKKWLPFSDDYPQKGSSGNGWSSFWGNSLSFVILGLVYNSNDNAVLTRFFAISVPTLDFWLILLMPSNFIFIFSLFKFEKISFYSLFFFSLPPTKIRRKKNSAFQPKKWFESRENDGQTCKNFIYILEIFPELNL